MAVAVENIIVVVIFLLIQLFADKLISSEKIGRFSWLSFSGGVAVAFIFVYILPYLHDEQSKYGESSFRGLTFESEFYLLSLIGLIIYFVIHNFAVRAYHSTSRGEGQFFWIQIAFFALYNSMVAYTVFGSDVEGLQTVFYGVAIGLHFMAISHDLHREDAGRYKRGRYYLAGGILFGWIFAIVFTLPEIVLAITFAVIAGAMIFNVLKKEMPTEESAHLPTFLWAAFIYTVVTEILKLLFNW